MQKRNLWEEIRDSSHRRSKVLTFPGLHLSNHFCMFPSLKLLLLNDQVIFLSLQASTASKTYKFVVTGHGKYQRMEEDVTQSGEFLYTKLCFSVSSSFCIFSVFLNRRL